MVEPSPPMPPWVKVSLVVGIVVVILAVVVAIAAPGEHGPGMHGGDDMPHAGGNASATDIGGPGAAADATRTIAISAVDSRFEPSALQASAGETVTFVVTNHGAAEHEFVLGDAAMQQQHARAMQHGMEHDISGWIVLQPGETKEVTWRFGDAPVEYACHEPGHYEAGMRGTITIA